MRSLALPYCFLFVKTLCCEFNLWLCVFRCYVGQMDSLKKTLLRYYVIVILGYLESCSCLVIVKGEVEKVLCVLNLFRQNQSEQNQICQRVYICLVDSSVFISLDIVNLIKLLSLLVSRIIITSFF